MKSPHTHYDNLKVARNAPPEVIRAAYKTLCQQFHPDRHGGHPKATQTFQLINAAYEVLSDPGKRRQHDEWIAKAEAREQARRAVRTPPRWNGQERRRSSPQRPPAKPAYRLRPVLHSTRNDILQWMLHQPRMLALWASIALTGILLVLIFHL
jgi:curved DNA-binding protein CbpA